MLGSHGRSPLLMPQLGDLAHSSHASARSCTEVAVAPSTANQVQRERALPDDTCRDRCNNFIADRGHQHSRFCELCVCKRQMVCCVAASNGANQCSPASTLTFNLLTPASMGTTFNAPWL